MVGVAGGACLSSGAVLQGLTPGVLGEIGVVGSTWRQQGQSAGSDSTCERRGASHGHITRTGSALPWPA